MIRLLLILLLAFLLMIGALYFFEEEDVVPQAITPAQTTFDTAAFDERTEAYVRENISSLSPEAEVLGGTFYVTEVEAKEGVGVVEYEDGHNAFTADFTYERGASGSPAITSFTVR
jgi:hypothetical protein